MASSMMASTAAVARVSQTNMVAPFNGLRSTVSFPATRKANNDLSTLPSNGGKVSCMQVWPPEGLKKFETLSYLPPLSVEALAKEVEYLLRNGWVPCIEFSKVQKQKNKKKIFFSFKSGPDSFSSAVSRKGSFTASTTLLRGTTMVATGPCGSCPCSGAPTPLR